MSYSYPAIHQSSTSSRQTTIAHTTAASSSAYSRGGASHSYSSQQAESTSHAHAGCDPPLGSVDGSQSQRQSGHVQGQGGYRVSGVGHMAGSSSSGGQQAYDPIAFERLIGLESESTPSMGLQGYLHPSTSSSAGYQSQTQGQEQSHTQISGKSGQQPARRTARAGQHPQTLPPISSLSSGVNLARTANLSQPRQYTLPPPTSSSISTSARNTNPVSRSAVRTGNVQGGSGRTSSVMRPWEDTLPSGSGSSRTSGSVQQVRQPVGRNQAQSRSHLQAQQQAQAQASRQRDLDNWDARAASTGSISGPRSGSDSASGSGSGQHGGQGQEEEEPDSDSSSGLREVAQIAARGGAGNRGRGQAQQRGTGKSTLATARAQAQPQVTQAQQTMTPAQAQRQAQNSRYAGQMAKVPVDMSSELAGGSGRKNASGTSAGVTRGRGRGKGKVGERGPVDGLIGDTATIAATLGANMSATPVRPGQAPVGRQVPRSATSTAMATGTPTTPSTFVIPIPPAGSTAAPIQIPGSMDPPPPGSFPDPSTASRARGRGGVTGAGRGAAAGRGGGGAARGGRGGNAVGAAARGRGASRGKGAPPGRVGPPPLPKPILRTLFQHAQAYVEKDNAVDAPSAEVDVEALIARQKQLIEEAAAEEERKIEEERQRLLEEARRAQAGGSDDGNDFGPGGFDLAEGGGGSEIDFSDSDFDVDFESDDSDYERSRQRRIEQNRQMMEQLGLGNADPNRRPDDGPLKKRRGRRPGAKDAATRKSRRRYKPAEYDEDGTTYDYCDKGERQRAAYIEIQPVFRSERIAGTYAYLELPPVPENPRDPDPSDQEDLPSNDDWWWIEQPEEQKPERKKRAPKAHYAKHSDAPGEMCHQCRRRSYKPMMICTNENPDCRRRYCISCVEVRYNFPFDDADPHWLCPKCVGNCNCSACLRHSGRIELLKDQIPLENGKRMNFKAITRTMNFQTWLEHLGAPRVLPREDERINAIRFIVEAEDIISPDIPDDVYDEIMYPHKKKPVPADELAEAEEPAPKSKRRKSRKSLVNTEGLVDPEIEGADAEAPSQRKRKRVAITEVDENGQLVKKRRGRPAGSKNKPKPAQYDENGVFQGDFDEYGNPIELDQLEGYADGYDELEEEGDEFERTYGYQKPPEPQPNSAGYLFGGAYAQPALSTNPHEPIAEPVALEVEPAATETAAPARPKPRPRKKKLTKKQQAAADAEAQAEAEAEAQAEASAAIAAAQLQQLGQQLAAAPSDSESATPLAYQESEEEDDYLPEADDVQADQMRHPANIFTDAAPARYAGHDRSARQDTPITVEESVRYAQQKRKEADAILARQGSGSGYGSGYGY